MIRIRFSTSDNAQVVRDAQYGFWATHVDVVLPPTRLIGALASGGVQARSGNYDALHKTREMFVNLPTSKEVDAICYSWLNRQIGKSGDPSALDLADITRSWQGPDKWFCSELVAMSLVICGFLQPLAAVNRILPRDLMLILSARTSIPAATVAEAA